MVVQLNSGRPGSCRLVLEGGANFSSNVSHALYSAVSFDSLQEGIGIFPAQPLCDAPTLQEHIAGMASDLMLAQETIISLL